MTHKRRASAALLFLLLTLWLTPAMAQDVPPPSDAEFPLPTAPMACDPDGVQASGARYRICMPLLFWNHDLVIWAHGYVAPDRPVEIPEDQMGLGGISIDSVITGMGYGFATTSYSTNGLAVLPGLADLVDLVNIFAAEKGIPDTIYLVGASEGGLITALAVEQYPQVFDGGLAMCGPYGDFAGQINHLGDFRVVFDHFFPGLMPGSAADPPDDLWPQWDSYYTANILPALRDPAQASALDQLFSVTGATFDPAQPETREDTVEYLLRYSAMATDDSTEKLGGQAFDNVDRVYAGSLDDARLNRDVARFAADPVALATIAAGYQTSGQLTAPLLTLHTTGDPLVPEWHANLYLGKVIRADNVSLHERHTSERYGHCQFNYADVLGAFNRMVQMVADPPAYRPVQRQFLPFMPAGAQ